MALLTSVAVMKYDTTGRFYYLTPNGAKSETGYDLTTKWVNADLRLKKHGRTLKRFLTLNPYNNNHLPQRRPIELFEFMVFQNANDEVQYIQEMLVEMVEWAYDTSGDRAVYEDGGGARVPLTVVDIAQIQGLQIIGDVQVYIEDDDYRVGY